MSKKDLLSQCREALGDATLTNLDLLNLIGEMKKELEHDRICGHCMNKEGGSTLTIRESNHVTDGFKGYKATLFAGEMSYTEINIPLRKGDDLFLHGNKDAGCIGYFSGSEVLLFGCYGLFARDDDSRYLLTKERR